MIGGVKVIEVAFLAWLLLLVPHSAEADGIRQRFDEIARSAQQKTGLDQIREINLSVNKLLVITRFYPKSPETKDWRSIDNILESKYQNDCKDFVVLKEELLRRVGIRSERILVLVRSTRELHVVLKIPYGEGEIILDNLRNVIVTMEDLQDAYEFQQRLAVN
jgi:predicted transglutaminase-like cysteine proteinase